jgi:hypothetical protein
MSLFCELSVQANINHKLKLALRKLSFISPIKIDQLNPEKLDNVNRWISKKAIELKEKYN